MNRGYDTYIYNVISAYHDTGISLPTVEREDSMSPNSWEGICFEQIIARAKVKYYSPKTPGIKERLIESNREHLIESMKDLLSFLLGGYAYDEEVEINLTNVEKISIARIGMSDMPENMLFRAMNSIQSSVDFYIDDVYEEFIHERHPVFSDEQFEDVELLSISKSDTSSYKLTN